MDTRYLEDLSLLKNTFDSGNEVTAILTAITNHSVPSDLCLLDVGIGEGNAILKVVRRLSEIGYVAHLTGVDLHISPQLREAAPSLSSLLQLDYLKYCPSAPFDVVIATQSLYYLDDIKHSLPLLLHHTAPSGVLILTVWSNRCVLFDLYSRFVCSKNGPAICSEFVARELHRLDSSASIELVRSVGTVNIGKWRESDAIRIAAYRILSRTDGVVFDQVKYRAFERHLRGLPEIVARQNGTIIFRRPGPGGVT